MPVRLRSGRMLKEEVTTKRARLVKMPKTNWSGLPFELREMIIDEMDSKTRCRFARCSKQCEKEAKESNNYLDSIRVEKRWIYMFVEFRYEETEDSFHKVYFRTIDDVKIYGNQKNSVEILVEGNVEETVARFVLEKMETYRKSLRKLDIKTRDYNLFVPRINFNSFRKLKNIQMDFDNDAEFSDIIGCDKILRAQYVKMQKFNLTFDQILKFDGINLSCRSNEMDEENINKYLKMFKHGEVCRNIELIIIYMKYEKRVNFGSIIEGLEVDRFESSELECNFYMTSKSEENKSFTVYYHPKVMLFIQCQKKWY